MFLGHVCQVSRFSSLISHERLTRNNDRVPTFPVRGDKRSLWPALNADCQTGRLFPGAREEIETGSPIRGVNGACHSFAHTLFTPELVGRNLILAGPAFPQEVTLDSDNVQGPSLGASSLLLMTAKVKIAKEKAKGSSD